MSSCDPTLQVMSLLDSDDDPYGEDEPVLRSHTGEALFGESSHKGRPKRSDRKVKGEDRKTSSKPVHWSKQKENVLKEKTPKKGKGQSSAKSSVSRTPPDSPKSSRPLEVKGGKGGVGVAGGVAGMSQQYPSPNMKSQRKRYSQLAGSSSSSEDETKREGEAGGFLFSNKPALKDDGVFDSNINASSNLFDQLPTSQTSNPFLVDLAGPGKGTLAPPMFPMLTDVQQQQAWLPLPASNPMLLTCDISSLCQTDTTPGGVVNPLLMMGEAGDLVTPGDGVGLETNPFLPPSSGPSFTAPPPPPSSPPHDWQPIPTATPTATPTSAEDWDISDDLNCKCVQQFNALQPVQGKLQGDKARQFFIQSNLPNHELSAIW